MLVASCPGVTVVSPEEVPAGMLARERDIEMNKEDIKSKPEAIRCVRICRVGARVLVRLCALPRWCWYPAQSGMLAFIILRPCACVCVCVNFRRATTNEGCSRAIPSLPH